VTTGSEHFPVGTIRIGISGWRLQAVAWRVLSEELRAAKKLASAPRNREAAECG